MRAAFGFEPARAATLRTNELADLVYEVDQEGLTLNADLVLPGDIAAPFVWSGALTAVAFIAIGALNENGIIGPLSPEVKPPQQGG